MGQSIILILMIIQFIALVILITIWTMVYRAEILYSSSKTLLESRNKPGYKAFRNKFADWLVTIKGNLSWFIIMLIVTFACVIFLSEYIIKYKLSSHISMFPLLRYIEGIIILITCVWTTWRINFIQKNI